MCGPDWTWGHCGACLSVFLTLLLVGHAISASEHFNDWGEQWLGCRPCPSPHRLALPPGPGCHPHQGTFPAAVCTGPAPSASRGKERRPCPSERRDRTPPAPAASPRAPPALCLAPSAAPGRATGCPSPGRWAAATGAKPHGAHSHIPRRWPCPLASPAVHFRKSRTLCPPVPPPPWGPSATSGLSSGTQVNDTPLVQGPLPAVLRG